MREHIDSYHEESKSRAVYLKHSTAHFNKVANMNFNSDGINQQNLKILLRGK